VESVERRGEKHGYGYVQGKLQHHLPLPAAYHAPLPPQSGGIIACRWEDIEGREWRNEWEIGWGWVDIR
jgi:hypothetical protein